MLNFRHVAFFVASLSLVACGGGGGNNAAPLPGSNSTPPPSVFGDMLAVSPNRGWNYHGSVPGSGQLTLTLYADPTTNGVTPLVLLAVSGTQADATSGTKQAAMTVESAKGYNVTSYTLYNFDGSIYADGALPAGSTLVLQTLTLNETFDPYTGMAATVTKVGAVPGASACPSPASGATVQYTFQGQAYSVSYVPGCGITQYVGNHGETFTLSSVGTYQLGTLGNVRRMNSLTLFDSVKSLWHVVTTGERLHNLVHP